MQARQVSRRDFLKIAGMALGAALITCTGLDLSGAEPYQPDLNENHFGEKTMSKKILVAYASQAGSTAGVAEMIGKTLAEGGAQVDVLPVSQVADLSRYGAVVVGSPIQSQQWLPEAVQFVRDHQRELSRVPFATFLVCMTLAMKKGDYRQAVATWIDPVHALVRPVSTGLFAGVLDIAKIQSFSARLKFRISVLMGIWSEGDHRDWNAIHAWAANLSPMLVK